MNKNTRKQRKQRTTTGLTALDSMVRHSANYVSDGIKARYGGPNAMQQIAKDISALRRAMNTEAKVIYTSNALANCFSSGPLIQLISPPAQGSADNQRDGDSLKVIRFDIKMLFQYSSGTLATSTICKQVFNWYLVRYKKTPPSSGTALPTIDELLIQDVSGNYTPMSFVDSDTATANFQVMADGIVEVQLPTQSPATGGTVNSQVVNVSHPCQFHQVFEGSAASNITDNCCFLIFVAMYGTNAGGASSVLSSVAQWYVDN